MDLIREMIISEQTIDGLMKISRRIECSDEINDINYKMIMYHLVGVKIEVINQRKIFNVANPDNIEKERMILHDSTQKFEYYVEMSKKEIDYYTTTRSKYDRSRLVKRRRRY